MNNNVKGTCQEMCPETEVLLREREGLLHILEIAPDCTEKSRKPKADRKLMVKSFSRSAAGKLMLDPKNLRPPDVLVKTITYLMEKVITNNRVPWHVTYDFIMDRLRAVRQDMIIQNLTAAESIQILQPIIRFYTYSSYRLCNESLSNFDPHINRTHLQECLKRLLCLYDELDHTSSSETNLKKHRLEFEALYLVVNLGNTTALLRTLGLPKNCRSGIVNLALLLSLKHFENNFVRVCGLIKRLPVLLQAAAAIHIPQIQRQALYTMSVAYNSKNLTYPLHKLQNLLLYEDVQQTKQDCIYYGLKCTNNEVHFVRSDFCLEKDVVQPRQLDFIDAALKNVDLGDLILNG